MRFLAGVACGIVVALVGVTGWTVWYFNRNNPMG